MRWSAVVVCAVWFAAPAPAQKYEISAAAGLMRTGRTGLGSFDTTAGNENDVTFRSNNGVGGSFTLNTRGYYGHEISYTQFRAALQATFRDGSTVTTQEGRVTAQQAAYNFMMYMMPGGERVRPFITVGATGRRLRSPPINGFDRPAARNYGANYGGGIKFKLGYGLIRLDVRHHLVGKPFGLDFADPSGFGGRQGGGFLKTIEASLGVGIAF